MAGTRVGRLFHVEQFSARTVGQDDRSDRQVVLACELQVALVVGGAAEDRARAIVHQHEVGDPDGECLSLHQRMADSEPSV